MKRDRHIVSVIIPTIGRDTLAQCQAALAKQTRPPDEVIVVIDRERRGPAWARNEGIRRAHGDLIALADDDAIPPDDWLERLVLAIDTYGAAVAGGILKEIDPMLDAIRNRTPWPGCETIDPGGWVGNTGNIMYARACLDTLLQQDGYVFNEQFKYSGEDWELMSRVRRHHFIAVFVPNHPIHLRRATFWQHLRHSFQRGRGIAVLFRIVKSHPSDPIPQDSLLWGQKGQRTSSRWFSAIWAKLVGPFDVHRFQKKRHFMLFWLGEKFQSVGFLWEMIQSSRASGESPKASTSEEHSHDPLIPAA